MALIQCDFRSEVLGMGMSINVLLPEGSPPRAGSLFPSLLLLHGLSDDHTVWQRRTSIELYIEGMGLAVVMPCVHRSFYTDMAEGGRYWTFVSEELPALCRRFFHLSEKREDNFVAGLSMGGYGAFKLALRSPRRFAAAASLSGALDIPASRRDVSGEYGEELRRIFGNAVRCRREDDVFACARALRQSRAPRPMLYQWCGTEDCLYGQNVKFRDHAMRLGLPLTYEEGPGGHNWDCWDRQIQRVLEWLPRKKRPKVR